MTDEHNEAVKAVVGQISRLMQDGGVPVKVGIDAMLTLSAVMISAGSPTADDAQNRVVEAGAKLVSHVMRNYERERALFSDWKGKLQ